MRILAIPDLHGKDIWKQLLLKHPPEDFDKIVFLGDYVDCFYHSDEEITENLQDVLQFKKDNMEKVVLLLGNHDIQYYYSYDQFGCSGYRARMYQAWHNIFQDNKELFQVAYQYRNFLFSHAGVCKGWLKLRLKYERTFSRIIWDTDSPSIQEHLNSYPGNMADKLNAMHLSRHYPLLHLVGDLRGGASPYGGVTWADRRETDRSYIEHFHQVVGHSKVNPPHRIDGGTSSITYTDCLDKLKQFFVLEDNEGDLVRTYLITTDSEGEFPIPEE